MRFIVLALPILALGMVACASNTEEEVSAADLTDTNLAKKALEAVGSKIDGRETSGGICTQCHNHDVNNQGTFKRWSAGYKSAMEILKDTRRSQEERINALRADPSDPTSKFDVQKLGIITAGANLGTGPTVSREKHPNTYAQNVLIEKLFDGKPEEYDQFLNNTLMPGQIGMDRMSPGQYEAILTWIERGLPQLDKFIADTGRPTVCEENLSELKDHASNVRARSWATYNAEARLAMFACTDSDPLNCFKQKNGSKDVFPDGTKSTVGKEWPIVEGTVRIAQDLKKSQGNFWTRTSADGRFVAMGGSPSRIVDLAARLDNTQREITVSAPYDPDFFPGNTAFMYQSTQAGGGAVCAQSLLTKPDVTNITFLEPECSKLTGVALYQTVAQAQGDNAFTDLFAVNNANGADNPSSTSEHDRSTNAGPEAKAVISVAVSTGTEGGYDMKKQHEIPLPFHGDTMASRTLELLGSRIQGAEGALGYAITKVEKKQTSRGYSFSGKDIGRICMPGNKANFSFDERFLATHHYLERSDFDSDSAWEPYKKKGGSEILMVDFVTGKKIKVLRSSPGQYVLFPHFRSDGWLVLELRDRINKTGYILVSDAALQAEKADPTP